MQVVLTRFKNPESTRFEKHQQKCPKTKTSTTGFTIRSQSTMQRFADRSMTKKEGRGAQDLFVGFMRTRCHYYLASILLVARHLESLSSIRKILSQLRMLLKMKILHYLYRLLEEQSHKRQVATLCVLQYVHLFEVPVSHWY